MNNSNGATVVVACVMVVILAVLVVIAMDVRNFSRFVDESRARDAEVRARVERSQR